MSLHDPRKQSLYFSAAILEDVAREARRLDRSASWVLQRAWLSARLEIRKLRPREPAADATADPPE
jgi:uncharacterized small protein (TIGR04563 family)